MVRMKKKSCLKFLKMIFLIKFLDSLMNFSFKNTTTQILHLTLLK